MNLFNRIVVVLLLLLLLFAALALAVAPSQSLIAARGAVDGLESFLGSAQAAQPLLVALGRIALAALALALCVPLLRIQFRRSKPAVVRVRTESGSRATLTTESVANRLSWHLDQLTDVIAVRPRVSPHGNAVDVHLDVETRPEVDVRTKSDEVVATAREVITEGMGLQLGKIDVAISQAPYQEGA